MVYPALVQTPFPSVARTASSTVDVVVEDAASLVLVIDVTVDDALASVVFNIDGLDELSGKAWTLLDSAAIAATGTTILRISPHLTASANTIAKDIIPPVIRVNPVHADADAMTYSVTVHQTR